MFKLPRPYHLHVLGATALCFLLAHSSVIADSVTGIVARVIDGDTIVVLTHDSEVPPSPGGLWRAGGVRVRLADIDAPELKQPYGPKAKAALVDMIGGKRVTVAYTRLDRYGRILGTITRGECNTNLAMVQSGHAWRYRYARKTGPIAEAERSAMARKVGLWAVAGSVPPWKHRREVRERVRERGRRAALCCRCRIAMQMQNCIATTDV